MGAEASPQDTVGSPVDERLRGRYLQELERTPLFHALPRRHRRKVARLAVVKEFRNDDVIMRRGEPGDSFYVILEGNAVVEPAAGHESFLWWGDHFGELSLIDGQPRAAGVVAAGPVTTACIARGDFQDLLHDEPALAGELLPGVVLIVRDIERTDGERIPDVGESGDRRGGGEGSSGQSRAAVIEGRDAIGWSLLLRHAGIFSALDETHLRRVAALFTIEHFADGDTVILAGTPGEAMYIILDGEARVRTPGGHTRMLGAEDCFGELALIDGAPRAATVSALGGLTVARASRKEFQKLLKEDPGMAVGLLEGLVRTVRDLQQPRPA